MRRAIIAAWIAAATLLVERLLVDRGRR